MHLVLSLLIALAPLAHGLDRPVQVIDANDGRLLIAQQNGRILVLRGGIIEPEPFADLSDLVSCCGNAEGLLSIALDPHFASNRRYFAQYVDRDQNTAIARGIAGDPTATRVLLTVPQPADNRPNHNGGTLAFGPDGLLYVSVGDGGDYSFVTDRAQHLDLLTGKLLRIDISGDSYSIPSSNPFVGTAGARGEIWAFGLRNPWRTSFDRDTGDLWIADVGETKWEEVDLQPAASRGGENYGWPLMEGSHCFQQCSAAGLTAPIIEYAHDAGRCSITGGFVYRGRNLPGLRGAYVYGDFCSGEIFAAFPGNGGWTQRLLLESAAAIVSFGETAGGELLVVDYNGAIYELAASRHRAAAH